MSRASVRAPFVVAALVVALVVAVGMPAPGTWAFWTAPVQGERSSAAQASTVPRVGTPTASVAAQHDVTVDWPDATLSDGTPVSGYVVTRTSTTGATASATGGCAGVVTASACVENDVPDGRWTYSVVARYAEAWVGPASAASAAVVADTVAPTNALSVTATSGSAALVGTTVFYRGAAAGSITIANAVSDGLSGPGGSATGQISGGGTRFTHVASRVNAPAGGPYVSNPISWSAGTTSSPVLGIDGFDVAGNNAAATLTFVDDSTAPTGGSIGYATTTRRAAGTTSVAIAVSLGTATDGATGSGIPAAGRVLERAVATLVGDACGAYGAWAPVQAFAQDPGSATVGAAVGTCVQLRYVVTDAVGNAAIATGGTVKVKPPYASVVGTNGLVDQFRFEGNVLANSRGTTGTTASAATTPTTTTGAIAGDGGTAASFDGSNDYIRMNRSIGGDFSIELWFRSTQGIGTGTQWYNGAGLVDAEVSGATSDFGISLASDGRVMAGVGSPDVTISSRSGLNDGAWHHVVMTRTQSSGIVELWIDGVSAGTVRGGTQALTAPASIDIGRLQTGIQYFRGSIDEVAIFSRVLTGDEIRAHHANAL
ncbi:MULTISPECIES: LamG-like jellyroll fold domain-containing protein [unclassified Agrococcus]|uniref:LamG-like jellyroll fold domain-containing protein n=1 Tax=unclassified Agrococcus TaxID=2615065 RepID=UPI003616486B